MHTISVQSLCKFYGNSSKTSQAAVRDLSFDVSKGQVVGFLGPNGAGKSTTLKILTGYLAPSSGAAFINGTNVLENPIQAQQQIGYLPENAPLYPDMTVYEYLQYIANIRGMGRSEQLRAIEHISRQCQITERWKQAIGELSKGFRQRVGLAQALIHDPPIVILDEPTTGLDPNQIVEMRHLIREIGRTKTVILSTHILSEVQVTCDRVLIIDKGSLVADGTVEEIIAQSQAQLHWKLILEQDKVHMDANDLAQKFMQIQGVEHCKKLTNLPNGELGYSLTCTADIRRSVFNCVIEHGLVLLELSPFKDDLESVFSRLTEGS